MYVKIRKRTLILFSVLFGLTVFGLCAGILAVDLRGKRVCARHEAEVAAGWRESVADLSQSLSALETDLQKGLFASGDYQTVSWAAQVFAEAGAARSSLEELPIYDLRLGGTETFLNQVGEFTLEMARKRLRGETLSDDEAESLRRFALRSRELAEGVLTLSERVADENSGYEDLRVILGRTEEGEEKNAFEALEGIFSEDAPLVYDGKYSAWYETRSSDWLTRFPTLTADGVKEKGAEILGVAESELSVRGPFETPFPYYECASGERVVAISERGGILWGINRPREVTETLLSLEAILYAGQSNLAALGYTGTEPISWRTSGHTVTAVYALKQEGILVYSDRITVTLAADNGEILSMNASEYVLCHNPDRVADVTVGRREAEAILRDGLVAEDACLVSLPEGDGRETVCWQLTVCDGSETRALVFVNAKTKTEEEIRMITEGEGYRRIV